MIDLLWPYDHPAQAAAPSWAEHLDLDLLARVLDGTGRHAGLARAVLTGLAEDEATIRFRQDLLRELIARPPLQQKLEALLPALHSLQKAGRDVMWEAENPLLSIARRVGELDLYVSTVESLREALRDRSLQSEGWLALRDALDRLAAEPEFRRLAEELPDLRRPLERMASVTLGVNLDESLRPSGATILSINEIRFVGQQSLLGRLLGRESGDGLTPLRPASSSATDPFNLQLLRDLERLVSGVGQDLASAVARYSRVNATGLTPLYGALGFYLGAARLVERLRRAGLPVTFPEVTRERSTSLTGVYDVSLALRLLDQTGRAPLILNDARLGEEGRLALLTGPNRGGKTTFLRAVGLAQAMAQAGLPVPAEGARLSPADLILTQFAAGESQHVGFGRFDQEVQELSDVFQFATPDSLILLNEPLSGTNPAEALEVARGVVRGLQRLGARCIIATHLYALAQEAPRFTTDIPSSPVVSLVASPPENGEQGEVERSFRIVPGVPLGQSRALEIARQHGLSPEQIEERLDARGIMVRDPATRTSGVRGQYEGSEPG